MSTDSDLIFEAFCEFLNGIESAVQSARAFLKKVKVDGWDPSKISWTEAEGSKGPYEKAAKQNGLDYQMLVRDLLDHDSTLSRAGYFLWLFDDKETVGRKPKRVTQKGSQKRLDKSPTLDVEAAFTGDLHAMLNFSVEGDYVTVRPKEYLGADNFRRIAAIVRDQLDGEYISAGRDSHFRIQVKK